MKWLLIRKFNGIFEFSELDKYIKFHDDALCTEVPEHDVFPM